MQVIDLKNKDKDKDKDKQKENSDTDEDVKYAKVVTVEGFNSDIDYKYYKNKNN